MRIDWIGCRKPRVLFYIRRDWIRRVRMRIELEAHWVCKLIRMLAPRTKVLKGNLSGSGRHSVIGAMKLRIKLKRMKSELGNASYTVVRYGLCLAIVEIVGYDRAYPTISTITRRIRILQYYMKYSREGFFGPFRIEVDLPGGTTQSKHSRPCELDPAFRPRSPSRKSRSPSRKPRSPPRKSGSVRSWWVFHFTIHHSENVGRRRLLLSIVFAYALGTI